MTHIKMTKERWENVKADRSEMVKVLRENSLLMGISTEPILRMQMLTVSLRTL